MAVEFAENRRFKRIPLALLVKGKCLERLFRRHLFQGKTRDISYEGLCVKVDSSNGFKVGQKVKLKTRLYPGDFFIKVLGRVCWVNELHDPEWPINIGVKLTNMRFYGLWVERIENKIIQS